MANTYLNKSTRFQCQDGNAVWFKAQNADRKMSIRGNGALLEDCRLTLIGGSHLGQCNRMPDPSTGAPSPCVATSISGVSWNNASNIIVSGKKILNSKCSVKCPRMGTVRPFKPTYRDINVDDNVSDISVNLAVASGGAMQVTGAEMNKEAVKKSISVSEKSLFAEKAMPGTDDQRDATVKVKYALCGYMNCDKAGECEYLKAEYCLKEADGSENARMLKDNIGKDAFDYYAKECGAIAATLFGKETYSIAHHHIIPAKQCFEQYPEIVKLANYYGYDINNALNGICLPTMNQGYDKQPLELRLKIAFLAMEKLGKQWHKGPHGYSKKFITEVEEFSGEIDDLFITNKPLKDYKSSVDEYLEQYRIKLENESKCRAKDYVNEAKLFCGTMNHISGKIANKLRKFESDPQKSHSFFVSKIALYYAYYNILKDYQEVFFEKE